MPLPTGRLTKRARQRTTSRMRVRAASDCPAPPSGPGCARRSRSACAAPAAAAAGRCAACRLPRPGCCELWNPASVQRPAFSAAIASTLPRKRTSRCSCACSTAKPRSSDRPSSWLANSVSTCAASSNATAKARSSSACSASICGASRACAWRSAHSSFSPNGASRRALALLPHQQRMAELAFPALAARPTRGGTTAPALARAAEIEPCSCTACSRSDQRVADPAVLPPRAEVVREFHPAHGASMSSPAPGYAAPFITRNPRGRGRAPARTIAAHEHFPGKPGARAAAGARRGSDAVPPSSRARSP